MSESSSRRRLLSADHITPEETIYLDDLGINLKPARALGMTTIKVLNAEQALTELEQHLGYTLR